MRAEFSRRVVIELGQIGRSLKYRLLLSVFALWTAAPAVVHSFKAVDAETAQRSQALLLINAYDLSVAQHLLFCPEGLVLAAFSLFSLLPTFTLLLALAGKRGASRRGAPTISEAIARGDDAGEPTSPSGLLAHATARWVACWAATGLAYLVVGATDVSVAHYPATLAASWGLVLLAWTALVTAVYTAIWTLLGVCFARRVSLLAGTVALLLVLFAAGVWLRSKNLPAVGLLPNALERLMLSGRTELVLRGMLVALAWCSGALTAACVLLRSRASARTRAPAPTPSASTEAV
jgi:hypothetical protein